MAARNSTINPGYTGYPARIYYEMTIYGRGTQTHEEKMTILTKWYSHLRSYLIVTFERDDKRKAEYLEKYKGPLEEVWRELEAVYEIYDPAFEGIQNCNTEEKAFVKAMRGVFERLDLITATAGIIDKIRESDEVLF